MKIYKIYKCKKLLSPFYPGGDNDFLPGNYYIGNIDTGDFMDHEDIMWQIKNPNEYFKPISFLEKIYVHLMYWSLIRVLNEYNEKDSL